MTRALPNYPESALIPPLVAWLTRRRIVRHDTLIVTELPWHGRRVDVVTLTRSGICTAYELKLGHTLRALEQSALNGISFDRSVIVTAAMPSPPNLAQAADLGLGVIVLSPVTGHATQLLSAKGQRVAPAVRQRVRTRLGAGAGRPYVS